MSEYHRVSLSEKKDSPWSMQSNQVSLQKSTHPAHISQKPRMNSQFFSYADAIILQKTIGNRAVCELMRGMGVGNNKSIQREVLYEEKDEVLQGNFNTIHRKEIDDVKEGSSRMRMENNTGLPDDLKEGGEKLSGLSLDDARVHYNSDKPAQVGALAYTQGADIYVAPGQEKHLPHEAWHVVQQAQGRVQSTMQMGNIKVNNDLQLEREADNMGKKAGSVIGNQQKVELKRCSASQNVVIQGIFLLEGKKIKYECVIRCLKDKGYSTKSIVDDIVKCGGSINTKDVRKFLEEHHFEQNTIAEILQALQLHNIEDGCDDDGDEEGDLDDDPLISLEGTISEYLTPEERGQLEGQISIYGEEVIGRTLSIRNKNDLRDIAYQWVKNYVIQHWNVPGYCQELQKRKEALWWHTKDADEVVISQKAAQEYIGTIGEFLEKVRLIHRKISKPEEYQQWVISHSNGSGKAGIDVVIVKYDEEGYRINCHEVKTSASDNVTTYSYGDLPVVYTRNFNAQGYETGDRGPNAILPMPVQLWHIVKNSDIPEPHKKNIMDGLKERNIRITWKFCIIGNGVVDPKLRGVGRCKKIKGIPEWIEAMKRYKALAEERRLAAAAAETEDWDSVEGHSGAEPEKKRAK